MYVSDLQLTTEEGEIHKTKNEVVMSENLRTLNLPIRLITMSTEKNVYPVNAWTMVQIPSKDGHL